MGRSSWETGRAKAYLISLTEAIDCGRFDPDVWVLEHVYQAFRLILEKWDSDAELRTWTSERLEHVKRYPNCLLSQISVAAARPCFEMRRGEFLAHLQSV